MSVTTAKISITVDLREKTTPLIKHWEELPGAFPGLVFEFADLECGDYVLGNGVVVERKSATDFMLSVMDKRVASNLAKLKMDFDHPIYIVEGDIFQGRFHSDPVLLRDALSYLTVVEGVPLVPSPGPQNSAELIYAMAKHAQLGVDSPVILRGGKPRDPVTSQRYLVEGLPGVGETLAKALLKKFGSAARVFAATQEQLSEVEGVTQEAAVRMRKILDAPVS